MSRSRSSSQAGFTLVEMLVALIIFALLSGAGIVILRSSIGTQAAVDARLHQISGVGRLHALLSADLGQAIDRPTRGPEGQRAAFSGDQQGMQFVRAGWTNLDASPRSDLQRVRWQFSGQALTRTAFRNLDGDDSAAGALPYPGAVQSVLIRYRLADGTWAGAFHSTGQQPLPSAVELTLTLMRRPPVVMIFALPQFFPQKQAAAA